MKITRIDAFKAELEKMPFQIIEKAVFFNQKIILTFKSGNTLEAYSKDPEAYQMMIKTMIKKIGDKNVVVIT